MGRWPRVLRVAFALVILGMLLSAVAITTGSDERWMYAVAPAAFAVVGLLLVPDVSGSATAYAATTAELRPLGVDYSRSLFANPGSPASSAP